MSSCIHKTCMADHKVLDEAKGLVEYVASDESLDRDREVIRAGGWRFSGFSKNSPFLDSHQYSSIASQIGSVVDFRVEGNRLIETVQWAKDVEGNDLAKVGWAMTKAGFLRGVSVGFIPLKSVSKWSDDKREWQAHIDGLGLAGKPDDQMPTRIFTEQEQIELSAVLIPSNPNALARAYKSSAIDDAGLETICRRIDDLEKERAATIPALVARSTALARELFMRQFTQALKGM